MSDAASTDELGTHASGEFWVDIDNVSRAITVRGALDIATIPTMLDATATLQGTTAGDITLDLEAVTFLDAATLGALIHLRAQHAGEHLTLHVIGNSKLHRLAEICGLSWLTTTTNQISTPDIPEPTPQ